MANKFEASPREVFVQKLDKEKRGYFKELDIMSDIIAEAMEKIGSRPEISTEELEAFLSEERLGALKPEQREALKNALDAFSERRAVIKRYYDEYGDKPEELFERVFGFKPQGQIEIKYNPWGLAFVLDAEDVKQFGKYNYIGGRYLLSGTGAVKIEELDGKVMYVGRETIKRSDTTGRERVEKIDKADIESSIEHEAGHAFWHDFLMKRKEASIAHRIDLRWYNRVKEKGFGGLPKSERKKAIDFIVQYLLNKALDGYFAGGEHREKFVREFGLYGATSTLIRALREDQTFLKEFEPEYKKRFFILYDVLKEVENKIHRGKLEALLYILPADRAERLLYFVNVNPKEWLEKWEKENSDKKLEERERKNRIWEDDFGGI